MGLQNMQNQNNLVLPTDSKPRLKWTADLHQRFVDSVSQLGGPLKATPKRLMRAMGVPGLTLYHLKSHLQKHRLGKSQIIESCIDNNKQEDGDEIQSQDTNSITENADEGHNQNNESLHITQSWRIQIEVQRKLHEQIEVQRHLQLRIEAQGKYLQSVLKKAQETLAGYDPSSVGVEHAKSELSHLVSELTETRGLRLGHSETEQLRSTICSVESSLTSSGSYGGKEETHKTRKRRVDTATSDDQYCVEKPAAKRSLKNGDKVERSECCGMLDLNRQYEDDVD